MLTWVFSVIHVDHRRLQNLDIILFMYRWLYVLERRSNPYEAMDTVVHPPDQENSLNTDEGVAKPFSGSQNGSQASTDWYCYRNGNGCGTTVIAV